MSFPARFWLVAISLLTATSCVRTPETYPAPAQHLPFRSQGPIPVTEFVSAGDPQVFKAVVKDVLGKEPGLWLWTGADPELRFTLSSTRNRTLFVEFVIHDRTFRDTGPVTISFYVNGRLAGEERYAAHGEKSFEKMIPAEWLTSGGESRVHLRIHNAWKSPDDGTTLGILLKRIGFVE